MSAYRILVVDDDRQSLEGLRELVRSLGHAADGAASAQEAGRMLSQQAYDLVITDIVLPGGNGLGLLKQARNRIANTPVVLVTDNGSLESAIEALRAGADDYFTKPLDPQALKRRLQSLLETRRRAPEPVGASAMTRTLDKLREEARGEGPVLLWGELGAGKEWSAGQLHESSSRRGGPWVALHLSAIPAELREGELFGTPARAGRLEQARGGTLFLDDLDQLPPALQATLAEALETGRWLRGGDGRSCTLDARLVAATAEDPASLAASGRLHEKLWRKLESHRLRVPALRERRDEIPALARSIASTFARARGRSEATFSPAALERLAAHPWPGNVRELRETLEKLLEGLEGTEIGPEKLPAAPTARNELRIPVGTRIKEVEREMIVRTLDANGGNKNRTAKQLGISRRSLYNKLERYRIGLAAKEG